MDKEVRILIEEVVFGELYRNKDPRIFELTPLDFEDLILRDLMAIVSLGSHVDVDVFDKSFLEEYFDELEELNVDSYFEYLKDIKEQCTDEFLTRCEYWLKDKLFCHKLTALFEYYKEMDKTTENLKKFRSVLDLMLK